MQRQKQIQYIIDKLSCWQYYVKLSNKKNYVDINSISEGFICNLLNILYDYNLRDLNRNKINFPGIDIGDEVKKVAFQITSRRDADKIIESYNKIYDKNNALENKLIADIFSEKIFFFIISNENKVKFQPKKLKTILDASRDRFIESDVVDISDLLNRITEIFDSNHGAFREAYACISNNIDCLPEIPTDVIIVEELCSCFNRPAFTVAFRDECNLSDFELALRNTISLINTGKSSDGIEIEHYLKDIASLQIKKDFEEVINGINKLRSIFLKMQQYGYATKCKCNNPSCKTIHNNDFEFCGLMNDLRALIIYYVKKINTKVGCKFHLVIDYCSFEKLDECFRNDDEGTLNGYMELIYSHYKNKLDINDL